MKKITIRIPEKMIVEINRSAGFYNDNCFNKELRDLITLGLNSRNLGIKFTGNSKLLFLELYKNDKEINKTKTAKLLGVSRMTINRWVNEFNKKEL